MVKRSVHLLAVTVAIAILATHWDDARATLADDPNPRWFALGFAGCASLPVITALRLHGMLRASEIAVSRPVVIRAGLIGYASNLVLPGAVGGDVVRATLLARRHDHGRQIVDLAVFDRLLGLAGLVLTAGATSGFWLALHGSAGSTDDADRLAWWALAATPVAFLVVVGAAIVVRRRSAAGAAAPIPARGAARALAVSVAGHLVLVGALWCFGRALIEAPPDLSTHFIVTPLALLSGALPVTPGGFGVVEFALTRLYEASGLDPASAAAVLVAYRSSQAVISISGIVAARVSARGTRRRALSTA